MPPMARGPYRYVRHLRYSAAILANLALALTLASTLGGCWQWCGLTAQNRGRGTSFENYLWFRL
jgi:protein-S-isoprenylcysteine O-methyltransferase Ste14